MRLAAQSWPIDLVKAEEIERGTAMKRDRLELVRGSGNVFRDLERENANVEQLKVLLAAEVIKALDREKLTVRAAQARTGFAAADFSRIRNADLARFTADRLMSILNRLGARVEVKIQVRQLPSIERRTARSSGITHPSR
jgi:predicted XRE-type DNA-binding protein